MGVSIGGLRAAAARLVGGSALARSIESEVATRVASGTRALSNELATVRRFAEVDQLTGIANRRIGMESISASLAARDARTGVAMFDIDHFKRINDTFGHAAGDDALVAVAGVLNDTAVRHGGTAARLGGEEFVMVFPGSDIASTTRAAADALDAVRQLRVPLTNGTDLTLTASAGVTASARSTVAAAGASDPATTILARADDLLYDAKRSGRDRLVAEAMREPV